jgi:hypothetical protein
LCYFYTVQRPIIDIVWFRFLLKEFEKAEEIKITLNKQEFEGELFIIISTYPIFHIFIIIKGHGIMP